MNVSGQNRDVSLHEIGGANNPEPCFIPQRTAFEAGNENGYAASRQLYR
jgi:hypothetical protein